mgnify:CR=1 FL=1
MKSSQPLALLPGRGRFLLAPYAGHHVTAIARAIRIQRGNRLAECRAQCRGMQVESGQKRSPP